MEHSIELSVIMAVNNNRLSIAKQLLDNSLITKNNFDEAFREDDAKSGIERGTVLMKALKATINQRPDLMTSLIKVLKENEAFKSIAMKMGQRCNNEVTDESTIILPTRQQPSPCLSESFSIASTASTSLEGIYIHCCYLDVSINF